MTYIPKVDSVTSTTIGVTHVASSDMAAQAAALLSSHFKLKRISVVQGGPSASDPMGEIANYMGFVDHAGNTYFIGVDDSGRIVKCGGTVNGRKYELPATERI